jgi:DNA-binding transcriptional MocR family regulator
MDAASLSELLGRWSAGSGPLHLLLRSRLSKMMDDGVLPPGTQLPPDRALAKTLAVGRSTVVSAYDSLRAEGRIVRRQGSGTRVAGSPLAAADSATGAAMFQHLMEPIDDVILLACAAPDTPPPEFADAYTKTLSEFAYTSGEIGYYPGGHPSLRREIADRYTRRGIPTAPDQVLVTSGAQQGLCLLGRALLGPGDRVLVEAPTYPGALDAFRDAWGVLEAQPVGLPDFETSSRKDRAALAYVVPTFHNPTGSVLPSLDRKRLAVSAAEANVWLIEDEVLADLAFPGEQVPPPIAMYGDRVISVGSLSKTIWGGLRIGWVRAPAPIIQRLTRQRMVHDLSGNLPAQLAATYLLPQVDGLCRRRAEELAARHDHLRAELARRLPSWEAPAVTGGQTLWVRLPHGDGTSFAQVAMRERVAVLPGASLDESGGSHDYIRIHFVLPRARLSEAVARLARAWRSYDPHASGRRY